jgi:hypothetical protein
MMQSSSNGRKPRYEVDLAAIVEQFLLEQGCSKVVGELKFFDRLIDLYGVAASPKSRSFAVELKLSNWQKALRQAVIYQLCADYAYVAMPEAVARVLDLKLFRDAGVGLLGVSLDTQNVRVVLHPARSRSRNVHYVKAFSNYLNTV